MTNGLVSSGYIMVTITSFVGMGEIVTKYIFDWASKNPKIIKASSIIARLMDDIVSHKVHSAFIFCYLLFTSLEIGT